MLGHIHLLASSTLTLCLSWSFGGEYQRSSLLRTQREQSGTHELSRGRLCPCRGSGVSWAWRILKLMSFERISVTIFAQAVTQNWRNLCPGGWQLSHGSGLLMRATARAGIDRVRAKCFLNANWNRRTAARSNPSSFVSQAACTPA